MLYRRFGIVAAVFLNAVFVENSRENTVLQIRQYARAFASVILRRFV